MFQAVLPRIVHNFQIIASEPLLYSVMTCLYFRRDVVAVLNPLTPELNASAQRCPPRFFLGILIFKGLTAPRLYKSFGVEGLIMYQNMKACEGLGLELRWFPRFQVTTTCFS
jgi:hypothetical protein